MALLSFGPQRVDLESYKGDTFSLSFEIVESNNNAFSKTGSWSMIFYDEGDNSEINTDPSGVSIDPIGNGFNNAEFNYLAEDEQTIFSGADISTNTLSYIIGTVSVFQNNVLISPENYTASTGTSVVLNEESSEDDRIKINCVSNIAADGVASIVISNELSDLISDTASVVYEFYLDDGEEKYTFINGSVSMNPRIFDQEKNV
jgi:hypothetical protein